MRLRWFLRFIFFILCASLCTFVIPSQPLQMRFVALSDIHFSPFTSCGEETPCDLIETLRKAPPEEWAAILAWKDKSGIQLKNETNYSLLASTLAHVYQNTQKQPVSFILVAGDFLAHNYRLNYEHYSTDKSDKEYNAFVKKTMTFLMLEFKSRLRNQDVYVAIGNNDTYQDHYVVNFSDSFFKDMGDIWSNVITDENIKALVADEMSGAGYYAFELPQQPHLRLIVLNSVLFSTLAQGNNVDAVARNQLAWLHHQLEFAKEFNQKALIVMHIPDGVDAYATAGSQPFAIRTFWQPEYSVSFESELIRYSDTIVGVLASHIHSDWIRVLHGDQGQLIAMSGVPSVSPISGNNPAYKIYSISTDHLTLSNFVTYSFPLNASSEEDWIKEYDFNEVYQPKCKYCALIDVMSQLPSSEAFKTYKRLYTVDVVTDTQYKFMPFFWCAINQFDVASYQQCLTDTVQAHR